MIWTQIRFYYILIFCYSKTSQFSQNPPIHQKCQNDVLCGNMNMDVPPKSDNYAIIHRPNFSVSFSHTCEKKDKTEGAIERCFVKIAVPNFQTYRVITYRFRKILA